MSAPWRRRNRATRRVPGALCPAPLVLGQANDEREERHHADGRREERRPDAAELCEEGGDDGSHREPDHLAHHELPQILTRSRGIEDRRRPPDAGEQQPASEPQQRPGRHPQGDVVGDHHEEQRHRAERDPGDRHAAPVSFVGQRCQPDLRRKRCEEPCRDDHPDAVGDAELRSSPSTAMIPPMAALVTRRVDTAAGAGGGADPRPARRATSRPT